MSSKMVLVPASMLLDKEVIGAINFHCGDGGDNFGEHSDGLLWVGAVADDEGKEVYGLHLATAEYPEEGSTTLVEFAAPVVESESGCKCQACGSKYSVDLIVPDDAWEQIKPEGKELGAGLLCASCIMSRLMAIGWSVGHLAKTAPIVELKPVDAILLENCEEVTVQDYGRGYFATDDCVAQLYTAPPELAELQATIASLDSNLFRQSQRIDQQAAEIERRCANFQALKRDRDDLQLRYDHLMTEIERLKGGQGEPVAWIDPASLKYSDNEKQWVRIAGSLAENRTNGYTMPLYASQPAPVSVLPSREVMRDLIAEVIGGDTYDCTRVWSAWGVGTMSEDDFVPLIESEERLYELADACLDKVKELNQ